VELWHYIFPVYLILSKNVNAKALVYNTISEKPHEIVAHIGSILNAIPIYELECVASILEIERNVRRLSVCFQQVLAVSKFRSLLVRKCVLMR
jgi:hypothetical protein